MYIIAVDLDGTICSSIGSPAARGQVKYCKPYKHMIKVINDLYDRDNFIHLYTNRDGCCERQTKIWLKKHKVKYHNITFYKLGADVYLDNKALPPYKYLNAEMIEEYAHQIKQWDFNVSSFRSNKGNKDG